MLKKIKRGSPIEALFLFSTTENQKTVDEKDRKKAPELTGIDTDTFFLDFYLSKNKQTISVCD